MQILWVTLAESHQANDLTHSLNEQLLKLGLARGLETSGRSYPRKRVASIDESRIEFRI
jgi:hypothetical protein